MKIGLISDVHGNWEALKVALHKLTCEKGVDKIYCSGDIIGYGPSPNRCVAELRKQSLVAVRGNHDAGLVGDLGLDFFNSMGYEAIKWTRKKLAEKNRQFIEDLPVKQYMEDERITLVHGSCVTPLTHYIMGQVDAFRSYQARDDDYYLQIYGHTHLPAVYEIDGDEVNEERFFRPGDYQLDPDRRYLVNPGSVGQPRDGNWKTSFAVLELDDGSVPRSVEFCREEYPAEKTRQKIIDAGLPRRLGERILEGR